MRMLVSLGTLHHPPEHVGYTASMAGLAARSQIEPAVLKRLLRLPAVASLVTSMEDEEVGFKYLSQDNRAEYPSMDVIGIVCNEVLRTASELPTWPRRSGCLEKPQRMLTHERNVPPFARSAATQSVPAVSTLESTRLDNFFRGMDALAGLFPFTGFYDLEAILERRFHPEERCDASNDQVLFVDVGGGSGIFLTSLLRAYPGLSPRRVVLQDSPPVVDLARLTSGLPPASIQDHDLFKLQPVRLARAYHLRSCLQRYSDEDCARILRQLVEAMSPHSKILVAENVMPNSVHGLVADPSEMTIRLCGGILRTFGQFDALFQAVGLRRAATHEDTSTNWALMEVVL